MSIVISAVPVLIISTLISASVGTYQSAKALSETSQMIKKRLEDNNNHVDSDIIKSICREYDTVFVNKDVLLKTLNDYGVDDIKDDGSRITCRLEGFTISFYKDIQYGTADESGNYKMFVKTDCNEEELQELMNNISEQYTSNTQEESYNKIKERLKKHNLEINDEEVLEDNSIVLTIDID